MLRRKFKYVEGRGVVPIEEIPPREINAPYVVDDSMSPLEHPCDGQIYDSKRTFRAVTRAHGCVEIGNDLLTQQKPRPRTLPHVYERDRIRWAFDTARDIHDRR